MSHLIHIRLPRRLRKLRLRSDDRMIFNDYKGRGEWLHSSSVKVRDRRPRREFFESRKHMNERTYARSSRDMYRCSVEDRGRSPFQRFQKIISEKPFFFPPNSAALTRIRDEKSEKNERTKPFLGTCLQNENRIVIIIPG